MITPAQFTIFISAANTLMGQAWADTLDLVYPTITTTNPSSTEQEIHGWTGMHPKGRKWSGPRSTHQAAPQTYTVVNVPWELTSELDRFKLDDDQFSIYWRWLPDLARQAKRWPDYWTRDLIEASGDFASGAVQNGFDGLTHWNTAHPVDLYDTSKGTYVNDYTGGGVGGVGGAFGVNALATVYEAMLSRKGEDGERLGVRPTHIMVPNELSLETELLLKSTFMAPPAWGTITGQVGAADNPFMRWGIDRIVNPHLLSTTKWYLLDNGKSHKAFGWQLRESATLAVRVNETDPIVFDEHKYLYGYWGRGAPYWGPAWLSSRSGP
jgi:phage major head subunit gpT-like protein